MALSFCYCGLNALANQLKKNEGSAAAPRSSLMIIFFG